MRPALIVNQLPDRFVTPLRQQRIVIIHHHIRRPLLADATTVEQDGPIANALNGGFVVRHHQQSRALLAELANPVKAFVLKVRVANRQRFVDNQDIRTFCGRYAESQAHLHTAGINPDGRVDVFANLGKRLDFRHPLRDLLGRHAQQVTRHDGVLTTGEVRVKPHAQLKQRSQSSGHLSAAGRRLRGAGNQLEQRALARAVHADDADRFPWLNREVDILQHPFVGVAGSGEGHQPFS